MEDSIFCVSVLLGFILDPLAIDYFRVEETKSKLRKKGILNFYSVGMSCLLLWFIISDSEVLSRILSSLWIEDSTWVYLVTVFFEFFETLELDFGSKIISNRETLSHGAIRSAMWSVLSLAGMSSLDGSKRSSTFVPLGFWETEVRVDKKKWLSLVGQWEAEDFFRKLSEFMPDRSSKLRLANGNRLPIIFSSICNVRNRNCFPQKA